MPVVVVAVAIAFASRAFVLVLFVFVLVSLLYPSYLPSGALNAHRLVVAYSWLAPAGSAASAFGVVVPVALGLVFAFATWSCD